MQIWSGVTLSCAALLIISGVPKLWKPQGTVIALRAVGVARMGKAAARALTIGEIVIGTAAIGFGGRWADAGVAVLYSGFSAFLVVALHNSTSSCGCTGRDDTPPTAAHLVMTTLFAACSVAAAISGGKTGIMAVIQASDPARSITLLCYAALVTWLSWAVLNLAARVQLHPQS
jgi:hypothetical protein